MTATPTSPTTAGQRIEQARYTIPAGTRGPYLQRIDGRVALVDVPVDHADRVLLVERQRRITRQAARRRRRLRRALHPRRAARPHGQPPFVRRTRRNRRNRLVTVPRWHQRPSLVSSTQRSTDTADEQAKEDRVVPQDALPLLAAGSRRLNEYGPHQRHARQRRVVAQLSPYRASGASHDASRWAVSAAATGRCTRSRLAAPSVSAV
jgi:hypothetical protein